MATAPPSSGSAKPEASDQYRVSTDTRSGIVNDPNREDDPQYILRLIGQVITVSLQTQRILASLPSLNLSDSAPSSEPDERRPSREQLVAPS